MSNIQRGPDITNSELELISGLNALAVSSATQAIQKTSANTFANVELNVSGAEWGQITGAIANQIDLQNALNDKEEILTFTTGLTRTGDTITIDNTVVTLTGAQALSNKTGLISQWTNDSGYLTGNQNITLSGDLSGSGTTSISTTLATVNSDIGTFNNITINAKGLATAGSNVAYLTGNQTITLSGDVTGSGATAITTNVGAINGVAYNADPLTQYGLLAGRATPQQLAFGNAASASTGYLTSTSDATKGKYFLNAAGTIAVDELNTRIGVGTASPTNPLHIVSASDASGVYLGSIRTDTTVTPAGTSSSAQQGTYNLLTLAGSNAATDVRGFTGGITVSGTGATNGNTRAAGILGDIRTSGAGNVVNLSGFESIHIYSATSTITNSYGYRTGTFTNNGTITNTYGFFAGDLTSGTQTNTPYSFYASDAGAWNYFAGNTAIGGTTTPAGSLHVDQSSTTAAIPVLVLDQADLSEEMIEFVTTIGTGNPIEAVGAKTLTTTHFIKVTLPGGLTRYIPCGTIA